MLVDLEAIDLYDDAFGEVLPHRGETWENIIGEIRWQCVKATPKNEELALKCFQSCLLKDDLEHARQVSSSKLLVVTWALHSFHTHSLNRSFTTFLIKFSIDCKHSRKEFFK